MTRWSWHALFLALVALLPLAYAEELYLTSDDYYATTCAGVWGQDAIPGGSPPYIKVTFSDQSTGRAALLIYEWHDYDLVGIYNNATGETDYICDNRLVSEKLCSSKQLGEFITRIPEDQLNTTSILTTSFDFNQQQETAVYKVEETGYYCVAIVPTNTMAGNASHFEAWVEWRFPYGELPSGDYPKLVLYGIFALLYLLVGIVWFVQSFRYWSDILPVQHFLSGAIFYLTVEMAFNWGFWEAYNQTGSPSWMLLGLVALLNAGRTSISFFMLLIVCMGYSVVKPSLGSAMKRCIILACVHFLFGVIYTLGTMLLSPDKAGFLVLLVIFPLSITMTAFYIWTLNSLTATIALLELRKQHVKVLMYKRLFRLLVFSVIMVVVIFIINMFNFSDRTAVDWAARNWKWRWFMLDGMLNVLYFVVFVAIIILWRPTSNNARYGLEQISQDEEEAVALENQLRHNEGLGYHGRKGGHNRGDMDDDAGIFELGGDSDDDENDEGGHVRLISVDRSGRPHRTEAGEPSRSDSPSPPSSPPPPPSRPTGRQGEERALLQEDNDSEEEEEEDHENAHRDHAKETDHESR